MERNGVSDPLEKAITRSAIQASFERLLAEEKKRLFTPLVCYLAQRYNDGEAVDIANLCDDRLDPTGNLLGWVREEAGKLRNNLAPTVP